ncbi:MAG: DUF2155 domain-containing protein [Pseudomonadota bacterium]
MRIGVWSAVVAASLTTQALAQIAADPALDALLNPPEEPQAEEEELSELDLLSRTVSDDPDVIIAEEGREPISVTMRMLDKITARYTDLEIAMNEIALFGSLEIQPRYCDTRPPEEFPETTVFLEVFDTEFGNMATDFKVAPAIPIEDEIETDELEVLPIKPLASSEDITDDAPPPPMPQLLGPPAPEVLEGPQAEGVNIFRGWMFASSPALNALEHPVYDAWVIDCKTAAAES